MKLWCQNGFDLAFDSTDSVDAYAVNFFTKVLVQILLVIFKECLLSFACKNQVRKQFNIFASQKVDSSLKSRSWPTISSQQSLSFVEVSFIYFPSSQI